MATYDITYPENGAKGVPFFDGIPFAWTENEDAVTYVIVISRNSDLSDPVLTYPAITETTQTIPRTYFLPGEKYYWGVYSETLSEIDDYPETYPAEFFTLTGGAARNRSRSRAKSRSPSAGGN